MHYTHASYVSVERVLLYFLLFCSVLFSFGGGVLGIELKILHFPGRHCAAELDPQPLLHFLRKKMRGEHVTITRNILHYTPASIY